MIERQAPRAVEDEAWPDAGVPPPSQKDRQAADPVAPIRQGVDPRQRACRRRVGRDDHRRRRLHSPIDRDARGTPGVDDHPLDAGPKSDSAGGRQPSPELFRASPRCRCVARARARARNIFSVNHSGPALDF